MVIQHKLCRLKIHAHELQVLDATKDDAQKEMLTKDMAPGLSWHVGKSTSRM